MPSPSIPVSADPLAETTSSPATHVGTILFLVLLIMGSLYIISQMNTDLTSVEASSVKPFVLLGLTKASDTSGVDWIQAASVGKSVLLSPLIGFSVAAFLLLIVP